MLLAACLVSSRTEGGISIPCNSISYIAPVSTTKLWAELKNSAEGLKVCILACAVLNLVLAFAQSQQAFETSYVVKMHAFFELAPPQTCFRFQHPNWPACPPVGNAFTLPAAVWPQPIDKIGAESGSAVVFAQADYAQLRAAADFAEFKGARASASGSGSPTAPAAAAATDASAGASASNSGSSGSSGAVKMDTSSDSPKAKSDKSLSAGATASNAAGDSKAAPTTGSSSSSSSSSAQSPASAARAAAADSKSGLGPVERRTIDNSRYVSLSFACAEAATMHGFIGYFDSKLYKDVHISSVPLIAF